MLTVLIVLPGGVRAGPLQQRGSSRVIGWILVSQVFPLILIIIPLFIILRAPRLLNTLYGLILVYVVWALPFTLWMLMSYVPAIPRRPRGGRPRWTDAAGCVIRRVIVLPLLAPGLVVTVLMFAFIPAWNEFFLALVVPPGPGACHHIPVRLARFVGSEGSFGSDRSPRPPWWPPSRACSSSPSSRDASRQGLLAGGVKG